jgi:hypothetical protein
MEIAVLAVWGSAGHKMCRGRRLPASERAPARVPSVRLQRTSPHAWFDPPIHSITASDVVGSSIYHPAAGFPTNDGNFHIGRIENMSPHNYKFEGWQGHDASAIEGKMTWDEFEPKRWEETDVDIKITHAGM